MTGARREDESVLMHGWSIRHLCKSIQCVFASNAVVWWCFPSYPHNESIFNGINNKKKRKESEKKENEETNCQSLQIAVHVRSRHPRMAYTCGHYEWFTTALEWMSRQCATQHKMMIDRAQHFKTSLHADFFSFFFHLRICHGVRTYHNFMTIHINHSRPGAQILCCGVHVASSGQVRNICIHTMCTQVARTSGMATNKTKTSEQETLHW